MPDYNETTVAGKQWQRCHQIRIENPLGGTPSVHLSEQKIVLLDGARYDQSVGGMDITFDPAAEIPLLNPADGTPLGATMTQGQIHVALWSLYMQAAAARDIANAPPAPEAPAAPAIDLNALLAAEQEAAATLAAAQAAEAAAAQALADAQAALGH